MSARLLIINSPSRYFAHIPMGTFGLCDYLNQRGLFAAILNLAMYDEGQMATVLNHYLDEFGPTHVGLTLHWQETAEGALWVGQQVRSWNDRVKILCGGFTAGYFGEELLKECSFIDYVVKGDPERPLELILKGAERSDIPNLVFRNEAAIETAQVSYCIDGQTLSGMSFCKLTDLFDYELYVKTTEGKLGFPLFIGRGCPFSCDYCGGSRESFRLHSERFKPVTRSIDAIVADLKRLKEFTRKIYICYEIDRSYIKVLFEAMMQEETLVKAFLLNYGAWELLDIEFLQLYKEVFTLDKEDKPLFEISPEIFDDKGRHQVKHQNTYSIQALKENLHLINRALGNHVKVSIFFSRYHDTAHTYDAMRKELFSVFQLKHDLFCEQLANARVYYDHLSTDVGSRYWERYVEEPHELDTLLSWIRRLESEELHGFAVNNLCIYTPQSLSAEDVLRCESMILILKGLERYYHELFHILFSCLGQRVMEVLEGIVDEMRIESAETILRSFDQSGLMNRLKEKISEDRSLLSRIPFIEDLTNLQLKKADCGGRQRRERTLHPADLPKLNHAFVSIHDHDYLDLPGFFKALKSKGPDSLRPQKTVFIFLADEILSMPYASYRRTLKLFEEGISLEEYYGVMHREGIFDLSYHEHLIEKLAASDVLH